MTFKLTFNCDNDAFTYNPEIEISRILIEVNYYVLEGKKAGIVVDINGNCIGRWEICEHK